MTGCDLKIFWQPLGFSFIFLLRHDCKRRLRRRNRPAVVRRLGQGCLLRPYFQTSFTSLTSPIIKYNVQHRPFLASLRAVATDGGDVGRSAIKDHLAADFKSEHINTALATFVSSTEGGYISGKHTEIVCLKIIKFCIIIYVIRTYTQHSGLFTNTSPLQHPATVLGVGKEVGQERRQLQCGSGERVLYKCATVIIFNNNLVGLGYAPAWPRVANTRGPTVERVSTTSSFTSVNCRHMFGDVRERPNPPKSAQKVVQRC